MENSRVALPVVVAGLRAEVRLGGAVSGGWRLWVECVGLVLLQCVGFQCAQGRACTLLLQHGSHGIYTSRQRCVCVGVAVCIIVLVLLKMKDLLFY